MSEQNHPVYDELRADPERRNQCWPGPLDALWVQLQAEAKVAEPITNDPEQKLPAKRMIPAGVIIGMGYHRDGRHEFAVARTEPPGDPDVWRAEVRTYLEGFGVHEADGATLCVYDGSHYAREARPDDEGKTVARFVSLRYGEVRPGFTLCVGCDSEITWRFIKDARQRCDDCARKDRAEREPQREMGVS